MFCIPIIFDNAIKAGYLKNDKQSKLIQINKTKTSIELLD